MISKFFVGQIFYEFFIACPGLFSVLIFVCFAHAGSLQVFSLGSLRESLCRVSKADNCDHNRMRKKLSVSQFVFIHSAYYFSVILCVG